MAQVTLWGASYSNVPSIELPKTGGGTVSFYETSGSQTITENGEYNVQSLESVTVNVQGGGSSSTQVGTITAMSYPSYVQFNGLLGAPTSFIISSLEEIGVGERTIVATVCYDGTTFHGQGISSTSNANVEYLSSSVFTPQYNNGTLTISASGVEFLEEQNYKLVYTYGGSTSDISTASVQVGSGATSITFPVSGRPVYWSCIFKSNFSTSSGYQRVIAVANDSSSTYGLAMDSVAHYATSWTSSYSGGNFTITSQGTNNGGYFHQPGYYQLTYYVDGSAPQYQSKTVTPTTSQQIVTPDSGYDALEQVTVNAMPTMTLPSSTSATSSGTSKATITPTSSTQYLNIPTGYNATAQYYTISASGGGGGSSSIATTTWTNSTNTTTSHQFTNLSGTPIAAFLRCTSSLSRSSSSTNYFIADMFWNGDSCKGNSYRRSNGNYANVTSGYSVTTSTKSITFTSSGTSTTNPGSFYNGTYELTYVY